MEKGITSIIGGNLGVSLIVGGSISSMWGMINSLQVVGVIPMMKINSPNNLKFVLGIVAQVVNFDYIDLED